MQYRHSVKSQFLETRSCKRMMTAVILFENSAPQWSFLYPKLLNYTAQSFGCLYQSLSHRPSCEFLRNSRTSQSDRCSGRSETSSFGVSPIGGMSSSTLLAKFSENLMETLMKIPLFFAVEIVLQNFRR